MPNGFIDSYGIPVFVSIDEGMNVTARELATVGYLDSIRAEGANQPISFFQIGAVAHSVIGIWQNPVPSGSARITFATASVRVAPTTAITIKVKIDSFNQAQHAVHTITIPAGQLFATPPGITDGPWALAYGDRVTISVESGNGEDLVVSLLVSGFGGTNQP